MTVPTARVLNAFGEGIAETFTFPSVLDFDENTG
jgi:hypothetical protein